MLTTFTIIMHCVHHSLYNLRKVACNCSNVYCHLIVCLSLPCLYVRLSLCPSICLSVRPSVCLSVCLSICPSVCLSVRPSICLSVRPSVRLSVHLSVCLSVVSSLHYIPVGLWTPQPWSRRRPRPRGRGRGRQRLPLEGDHCYLRVVPVLPV